VVQDYSKDIKERSITLGWDSKEENAPLLHMNKTPQPLHEALLVLLDSRNRDFPTIIYEIQSSFTRFIVLYQRFGIRAESS